MDCARQSKIDSLNFPRNGVFTQFPLDCRTDCIERCLIAIPVDFPIPCTRIESTEWFIIISIAIAVSLEYIYYTHITNDDVSHIGCQNTAIYFDIKMLIIISKPENGFLRIYGVLLQCNRSIKLAVCGGTGWQQLRNNRAPLSIQLRPHSRLDTTGSDPSALSWAPPNAPTGFRKLNKRLRFGWDLF